VGLFKYTGSEWVDSFRGGSLLFRPISFYQRCERAEIGDRYDGQLLYKDAEMTVNPGQPDERRLRVDFVSGANPPDDIFVHCLSKAMSSKQAHRFGCEPA